MEYLRFFTLISTLCIFLLKPVSSPADTAQEDFELAIALAQSGSYSAAKDLLKKLIRKDKKNGLYWFNLAQVYRAQGKEKYALFAFKRAAKSKNQLASVAAFEVAENLYANNKPVEAAKTILKIRKKHLTSEGRKKLKTLKETTRKQLELYSTQAYSAEDYQSSARFSKWALRLKGGELARKIASVSLAKLGQLKAAKNLNAASKQGLSLNDLKKELDRSLKSKGKEKEALNIFSGFAYGHSNNVFSEHNSDAPLARAITQSYLGSSYTHKGQALDIEWLYFLSWNQAFDVSTSETLTHSLENSYTINTTNAKFAFTPNVLLQMVKGEHYISSSGLSLSYSYYTKKSEFGASLDWTQTQGVGDANYLSGPGYRISGFYGTGWGRHYLSVDLSYDTNRSGDFQISTTNILPGAYVSWSPSLNHYYSISKKFNLSTSLTYIYSDYLNTSSGERQDHSLYTSLRFGYQIHPSFNIYINTTYNQNSSNFDTSISNQNYNQTTITSGFNWDLY